MNNVYILVEWPESQMLMEEEWFNECVLALSDNICSSSYFVPLNRYKEYNNQFELNIEN